MTTPLIAIPAYHLAPGQVGRWPTRGSFAVPEPYVEALRRAGARTAILTEPDRGDPDEILGRFDGLLLIGGGDIEPGRYGSAAGDHLYGIEPERDELEIALVRAADRLAFPTLAICRGFQVVNVAFGGTLHQHLHEIPGYLDHRDDESQPLDVQYGPAHDVVLEEGGVLRGLANAVRIRVNSLHHQGVERLGDGLIVEARAPDGVIEAFRVRGAQRFALAVQWHPEWKVMSSSFSRALFASFGAAARDRAQERTQRS